MKRIIILLLIVFLFIGLSADFVRKSDGKKIYKTLLNSKNQKQKVWILFTDKGLYSKSEMNDYFKEHSNMISKRTIEKRKIRGVKQFSFEDIPVNNRYIDELNKMNIQIVHKSKWLNGVSAYVNSEQLNDLNNLDFIYKVYPVAKTKRIIDLKEVKNISILSKNAKADSTDSIINKYDYGNTSKPQIEQIRVNKLHNMGYTGDGVIIAIFDTGFKIHWDSTQQKYIPYHEAIQNVNIIKTYNFIDDTEYVGQTSSVDTAQVSHGTKMLSLIGAYKPGELISPAFGADFVLAETENASSELPSEEDNWIVASEWADSIGVDIISSSVGYKNWYSYDMMTGDSCLITKAADIAASKGILVVNAIGNFPGDTIITDTSIEVVLRDTCIIAPADADSIITVGGVDDYNMLATVSVTGPTYDKYIDPSLGSTRIKPEVSALAEYPWCINTANDSNYVFVSGTSGATALIAGGCALLKQAHPDWTAMQIRDAIIHTAYPPVKDAFDTLQYWYNLPNDTVGFGIADFYSAVMYADTDSLFDIKTDMLLPPYPNPFSLRHQNIKIPFELISMVSYLELKIFTLDGKLIYSDIKTNLLPGIYMGNDAFLWDGRTLNGKDVAPGIYIVMLDSHFYKSMKKIAIIP